MRILDLNTISEADALRQAVDVLSSGGMIVYPTETTYGLGVDATNQQAVDKLLKFKGQRGLKPISVAVADQEMAQQFVELNTVAKNLYKKFLPGPLTIVSKIITHPSAFVGCPLARGIISLEGTLGIRIPKHSVVIRLIKRFGRPITATSANISGARHPWSIKDIQETTPEKKLQLIDLFLDAGELPKHRPSTIVNTANERTEIVREGELEIRKKGEGKRKKEKMHKSESPEETERIASHVIEDLLRPSSLNLLPSSLVLTLQGPLGAGKTVFAKGVARALGITEPIRSPSYQLVREYRIPDIRYRMSETRNPSSGIRYPTLYHIDAWRLASPEEFVDLGLERMLEGKNVIVIEWPERVAGILPELQKKAHVVFVEIEVVSNHQRRISVSK